jgi:hypothetical protein
MGEYPYSALIMIMQFRRIIPAVLYCIFAIAATLVTVIAWLEAIISIDRLLTPGFLGIHHAGESPGIVPWFNAGIAMMCFLTSVALWQAFGRAVRMNRLKSQKNDPDAGPMWPPPPKEGPS